MRVLFIYCLIMYVDPYVMKLVTPQTLISSDDKEQISHLYESWFNTSDRWGVYTREYFLSNVDERLEDQLFLWMLCKKFDIVRWYVFGYWDAEWMKSYLASITDVSKIYDALPHEKKIFWIDDLVVSKDSRNQWLWSFILKSLESEVCHMHGYNYIALFTLLHDEKLTSWYQSKWYDYITTFIDEYACKEYALFGKNVL